MQPFCLHTMKPPDDSIPVNIEIVYSVEIFLARCLVQIVLLQPPCFPWPSQGATFFPLWNRVTGAIFDPKGDLKYA